MCTYHKGTRAQRCMKCGANNCLKCLSGMPPEGWALCQPASVEEPELLPPLVEAPPPPSTPARRKRIFPKMASPFSPVLLRRSARLAARPAQTTLVARAKTALSTAQSSCEQPSAVTTELEEVGDLSDSDGEQDRFDSPLTDRGHLSSLDDLRRWLMRNARLPGAQPNRRRSTAAAALAGACFPASIYALTTMADRPFEGGVMVRALLDTGADAVIVLASQKLEALSTRTSDDACPISGVGGNAMPTRAMSFAACLANVPTEPFNLDASELDDKNLKIAIVSYAYLRELTGCTIMLDPELTAVSKAGQRSTVHKQGRHYFIDVALACTQAAASAGAGSSLTPGSVMAAVTKARSTDPAFIHAKRLGLDAAGLKQHEGAILGLEVGKISAETTVLINNDEALRRSRHVRRSAAASTPVMFKPGAVAGRVHVIDGWPSSVPCAFTKHTTVIHSFDKCTTFGYAASAPSSGAEDVIQFAIAVKRAEKAVGHDVQIFQMDALQVFADFSSDAKKAEFESRVGALLDRAAGDDHEFMTVGEACMQPITRRTEAAMFCARSAVPPVPDSWMIKCRLYQVQIMNILIASGKEATRMQLHTNVPPSIRSSPMPMFYTKCSVHAIGGQGGFKGLMDEDHSSRERTARVVGYKRSPLGSGVLELIAEGTNKAITRHPKDADVLDEHILATAGLAAGTAQIDVETQCDVVDLPSLTVLAPPPAKPAAAPKVIREYVMPADIAPQKGARLRVLWEEHKGDGVRYFEGTVTEVVKYDDGTSRHRIRYDAWKGKDALVWHDLPLEQATGSHAWHVIPGATSGGTLDKVTFDKPKHVTFDDGVKPGGSKLGGSKQGGSQRTGLRPRTKEQSCALSIVATVDQLVACSADPCECHDQCMHLFFGAAVGSKYETDSFDGSLGKASCKLYGDIMKCGAELNIMFTSQESYASVLKASKGPDVVRVRTDSGEYMEYVTPTNLKTLLAAPDSVEWLKEEANAVYDSILALPGHGIIGMEAGQALAKELKIPIASMVTTRKYKLEDERIKRRKVRHSFDENRVVRSSNERMREVMQQYACHTMPVGAMEMNLFLFGMEDEDYFALLDWKDAYGLGTSARGIRLAYPPASVDLRTDTNEKALLMFGDTGIWGEGPAGREFEDVRDEDMAAAAWPPIKEVPAYFHRPGGNRSYGASIIDDLAVRSTSKGEILALHAYLSKRAKERGGQPLTIDLTEANTPAVIKWGGMRIMRDPERRVIEINMPAYIEMATLKWLPSLVRDGHLPDEIPKNKKLRDMLDGLAVDVNEGRLTQDQMDVMAIAGILRWGCRRVIRILRATHLIASVQHRSKCPEAKLAALGVLACLYHARNEGQLVHQDAPDPAFRGVLRGTVDARRSTAVKIADGDKRLELGAPKEHEGLTDTTWSKGPEGLSDVTTLALTWKGAAFLVELQKSPIAAGSSAELEGLGLLKVANKATYARIAMSKLGEKLDKPTTILCDAEAALRAAAGETSVNRLKHSLRRAAIVRERVLDGEIELAHIPDVANAVDIFTKLYYFGHTRVGYRNGIFWPDGPRATW